MATRKSGDYLAAASKMRDNLLRKNNIQDAEYSLRISATFADRFKGKNLISTSTPKSNQRAPASSRVVRIPRTPRPVRNNSGIDESHLLTVQELRSIFSPAARKRTENRASKIVICKPKPTNVNKTPGKKIKIISNSKLSESYSIPKIQTIVEDENLPLVIKEEIEKNESVVFEKEVNPKSRVPFFYVGTCRKGAHFVIKN